MVKQIYDILITPPGHLSIHLVLTLSVIVTLQSVVSRRHNNKSTETLGANKIELEEVTRLQEDLAIANSRVQDLEKGIELSDQLTASECKQITNFTQDLHQPMASIVGYTDLLMSENAGVLGALQLKLLERIKASTKVLNSLVEDMIQKSGLDEIIQKPVDIGAVIDNAIANVTSLIKEKSLVLRINLPEVMPKLKINQDVFQQIITYLLENACLATPVEGTISLRVQLEDYEEQPYLLTQVIDSGGGIAPGDLRKVFARTYRDENPEIKGVGDTGVGLSLAKILTDVQGGRIWVDTEPEQTSTFSVLLPIWSDYKTR